MKTVRVLGTVLCLALLVSTGRLTASGPLGFYGVIEKVVFEPDRKAPERVQIWGAFAYANGQPGPATGASEARRGYLYFTLPSPATPAQVDLVKTEWTDLAAVAGTGQAVGFGSWAYVGIFPAQPDAKAANWMGLGRGGAAMDLRVRPVSETPANPAMYETNVGLVKLAADGSHAEIVAALKDALK